MHDPVNRRILIIDDNRSVHEDFIKIIGRRAPEEPAFDALAAELFGDAGPARPTRPDFDVDSTYQGAEGLELVRRALAAGRPYAMAFVDVRMPPGWDGIETLARVWEVDPDLQAVICSAYSDHSWEQIVSALGNSDRFVILRKPFDNIEVTQLASALTAKWDLARRARTRVADLEHAVALRTRELELAGERLRDEIARRERTEIDLAHALKLEAMGRLAAGIAHEINSPMQYVSGSLAYIEESLPELLAIAGDRAPEALTVELPVAVRDARTGVARVAEIIHSMKALSHHGHGHGHGQPAPAPVDVNEALSAALTVCKGDTRHVAEVVAELADVPPVLGSAGDLGRLFVNLIVNAIDAIREATHATGRRGLLRVRTRVDGNWVETAIEDNGSGIAEAIRERIFEPFFTTKPVGRGSGQGLAIARRIVEEQLRGVLTYDTAVGKGTTFYVRLPLPTAAEMAA